tara:strand:+ start:675 stop:1841 length:1167 start_codon:yes stop_codon:yes gene_type:complete
MRYFHLLVKSYIVVSAVLLHAVAGYFFLFHPILVHKAIEQVPFYSAIFPPAQVSTLKAADVDKLVQQELLTIMPAWQPLETENLSGIWLDGQQYTSLPEATKQLKDGSHLKLGPGIYNSAIIVRGDNVIIEGYGHVVFEKAVADGKGAILARGDNLKVKNIECRFISVASKNGACVRLEGSGLTLEHVYFHSSQSGLLETAKKHGRIIITDSRFENLAKDARAHSIYLNTASLLLTSSVILANRNQHSLKSRGPMTVVDNSIIASLSGKSSRLIDISNGGELHITNSLLQHGPGAVNNQAIGFGLEGVKHDSNKVLISNSVLLLERANSNFVLHAGKNQPEVNISSNLIIGANDDFAGNHQVSDRATAQLPAHPKLPDVLCNLHNCSD